jgi:hypothetical protein
LVGPFVWQGLERIDLCALYCLPGCPLAMTLYLIDRFPCLSGNAILHRFISLRFRRLGNSIGAGPIHQIGLLRQCCAENSIQTLNQ